MTTGENIVFATNTYIESDVAFHEKAQITARMLCDEHKRISIQPRVTKEQAEQAERTRQKAEVFTPSWLCNKMNNHCDEEWFGKACVFNTEREKDREINPDPIPFKNDTEWQAYVDSRRIEITCGEAPYIVSRYDAATGELIPVERRIGFLDRKLRVVNENTHTEADWLKWVIRAFRSVYGYEFQGDSLIIARVNLLETFVDYMKVRWNREPTEDELAEIAEIIVWNIWQMDGLTGFIPFAKPIEKRAQMEFDFDATPQEDTQPKTEKECRIFDWQNNKTITFNSIKRKKMKFDFCIGNPPYQEDVENNGRSAPVYNKLMDVAFQIADCVELVTPARFLFNAGQTPKDWNRKMLKDKHFKVLEYYSRTSDVFTNVDIPGGVSITLRNKNKEFEPIDIFIPYEELRSIYKKVFMKPVESITDIATGAVPYSFTDVLRKEHPEYISDVGDSFDLRTNILDKMFHKIFFEEKPDNTRKYVQIYGLENKKRVFRWIDIRYLNYPENCKYYKIIVPKSNGSPAICESSSTPLIGTPLIIQPFVGHTQTFISFGKFDNETEARNCLSYIKSKFARTMLGILKITQDNPPEKWKYVPLQDFTSSSDIDWTGSIADIDRQLYRKYKLSDEEIDFIETHVKEMA